MRDAGVTTAVRVSPQHTLQLAPTVLSAGVDLLVIQGTIVSAEHVTTPGRGAEPQGVHRRPRRPGDRRRRGELPDRAAPDAHRRGRRHRRRRRRQLLHQPTPSWASGCRWPAPSPTPPPPAATTSTRPAAGTCTSSPTAGSRPAARSPGRWPAARTPSSSASRCGSPPRRPAGGIWWDSVAAHPRLPRGGTSAPVAPVGLAAAGAARARRESADGRTNLFGALRRTMAKTGYRDLKEFQRVDLVIGGHGRGSPTDGLPDRSRRRLRRPVRAADRPPGPRGRRLLRDRAARRRRSRRSLARKPAGDRALRRPVAASTRRAPRRSTRRCSRPACRRSASATASRRWRSASAARSRTPATASTAAPR